MYLVRLGPLLLALALLINAPPAVSQTLKNAPVFQRTYKATAYISLFSIPILSRSDVGFGWASVDEQAEGSQQIVRLRFLSGSTPERAHGLNRFGFIQEVVHERDGSATEAAYFGLITANSEESFAQAKAALETKSADQTRFVAAQATINEGCARYSIRHMLLPSSYRGSNADQLVRQVQVSFSASEPGQEEIQQPVRGEPIGTFLYSLRQAMLTEVATFDTRFVYNGKTFKLHAEKRADQKATAELRKAGLADPTDALTELSGAVRNEKTNETTGFRLWYSRNSPNVLPLRFEFKPKSYLRLVFDAKPDITPVSAF